MALLFGDPTAHLDPAVREIALSRATSERMFFYLQRLPLLLFLQAESFYQNLLNASQYERVLGNLSTRKRHDDALRQCPVYRHYQPFPPTTPNPTELGHSPPTYSQPTSMFHLDYEYSMGCRDFALTPITGR